jgi:hypothetical protein
MRTLEEVKYWKSKYRPLRLRFLGIQPFSKLAYRGLSPWDVFRYDGNLAIQYDGQRHIFGDVDTLKLTPLMRKIIKATCSWRSPKGYGFILSGPVSQEYYDALYALRCIDLIRDKKGRWLWDRVDPQALKLGRILKRRLVALGMTDNMPLHGIFRDMDTLTYVLVPPSRSCIFQGANRMPVNRHSSAIPLCNSVSPDGRHHFFERQFLHYTTKLMTFDEFMNHILNN